MDPHEKTLIPEDNFENTEELVIENLPNLIEFLKNIKREVFSHYVSKSHHEIADWIEEGQGDERLAKRIRKTIRREKIIKILEKELKKKEEMQRKMQKIKTPRRKRDILTQLQLNEEKTFGKL